MYLSHYSVIVDFDQSAYGVMESDSTVSVGISLSQPSPIPFQVEINTIDVTAEGNINFVILNTCLSTFVFYRHR